MNEALKDLVNLSVTLRINRLIARGDIKDNWECYRHIIDNFEKNCLENPGFSESILFRVPKQSSSESFNHLCEAIAIMACAAPGGIEFMGVRYDASNFSLMRDDSPTFANETSIVESDPPNNSNSSS